MALKEYDYAGSTYQFEEDDAPEGAVLTKRKSRPAPRNKQAPNPANKDDDAEGDKAPSEGEETTPPIEPIEPSAPAKDAGKGKGKTTGKEGSDGAGDPSTTKS